MKAMQNKNKRQMQLEEENVGAGEEGDDIDDVTSSEEQEDDSNGEEMEEDNVEDVDEEEVLKPSPKGKQATAPRGKTVETKSPLGKGRAPAAAGKSQHLAPQRPPTSEQQFHQGKDDSEKWVEETRGVKKGKMGSSMPAKHNGKGAAHGMKKGVAKGRPDGQKDAITQKRKK